MRGALAGAALVLCLCAPATAGAVVLTQVSSDPYINSDSQHATEVEPDTFAAGTTMVAAFQAGRFTDGGSSNVGWATTSAGWATWSHGFLPSTTTFSTPAGPYSRATDPSVAYDAKDGRWLISTLALKSSGGALPGVAVLVSSSTDGVTWGAPVVAAAAGSGQDFDKDWIVCDDTTTSPHYGNCYLQWDDFGHGDEILMSTSPDGGLTWGAAKTTGGPDAGLGGQPVVQSSGRVVVPFAGASEGAIGAFQSADGGASWSAAVLVSDVQSAVDGGNVRSGPLPSAEIGGDGRVYVVWEDCRFRPGCPANDIVLSTSTDGTTWSSPARVPIDGTSSGVDHFIPGLAVDRSTSGGGTHLGLTYYYYPSSSCSTSTCQLDVGYVSSLDGGASWSAPLTLAGPMSLGWLASTDQGSMVGDYISTSFLGGSPYTVVAVAQAPSSSTLAEGMWASSALPLGPPAPPQPPPSPPPGTTTTPTTSTAPATPAPASTSTSTPAAAASTPAAPASEAAPVALRATVASLPVSPFRFRAARSGPAVALTAGATVTYSQSQAGRTTFSIAQARTGRMRSGRCTWVTRANRRARPCTRYMTLSAGFARAATAGVNRFELTGRLDGHALPAAEYRLAATPYGSDGRAGTPATAPFQILRPARRVARVAH